ncbi:MAG: hypothetical protein ACXWWC_04555, partial [Chitinophagaceae bacterium]
IPGMDQKTTQAGAITSITINASDKTASFAYISKVYPQPAARSYNEAKGLVMNDYQVWLEEEWIKELKKKYPVVVDQKVLAGMLK